MLENKKEPVISYKTISELSNFTSSVDIIIPYHGQYGLVTSLVESIYKLTRTNYYNIILVDDNSPNVQFGRQLEHNSKIYAQKQGRSPVLKTIRNSEQKGYSYCCKIGYDSGESPYVCFMNSDCKIVDPNWMKNLGESLLNLKSRNVRMIAPMTDNNVGGSVHQIGKKGLKEEDVILEEDDFLSLPCFMCHRELFAHCGGFLKEYQYGLYEDEEFSHRLKKHGFKQAVCRSSFVEHKGSATILNLWKSNPEAKRIMTEHNRERCIEDIKSL